MIRIIANCKFGYWNGTSVEIKTKNDAPFSVSPEREAELVELGLAAYVDEAPVQADVPQADADADNADDGDTEVTAEYLNGLKLDVLKEFAEQFGIEYKSGTKKVDFVDTIMAKLEADAEAQADTNAGADPDADADGDAPTFDAGSAIE